MGKIFINRNGTNLGTFDASEVKEGLTGGRFLPGDLAWQEGMPEWKPLGEWPEFPGSPGENTPDQTGSMPALLGPELAVPSWERRDTLGVPAAILDSLKQILLNPVVLFSQMKKTGGFGGPFIFYMILAVVGSYAAHIYESVFNLSSMVGVEEGETVATGIGLIAGLILIPFVLAVAIWISSGIIHLFLMMLGGAKQGFETTFRVACYAAGATAIFSIVPLCGAIVGGIYNLALMVIGIHKAHGIPVWMAVVSVLGIFILCCGIGAAVFLAFGFATATGTTPGI